MDKGLQKANDETFYQYALGGCEEQGIIEFINFRKLSFYPVNLYRLAVQTDIRNVYLIYLQFIEFRFYHCYIRKVNIIIILSSFILPTTSEITTNTTIFVPIKQ